MIEFLFFGARSVIKAVCCRGDPIGSSLSLGRSLGACAMAFGSGDYLYCSHSTCRRRFCSESALAKHYGSFHGRPTCDTCGKKLKKSGKVSLLSLSLPRPSSPTNPPPQHTCTLLDTSAFLEVYPALDFVSHTSDLDYGYDTENAEVRVILFVECHAQQTHHINPLIAC